MIYSERNVSNLKMRNCVSVMLPLTTGKHFSHRFAAEFDFRTFDPEGVILYAESSPDSWFMLGLRSGRIEVQFKNEHSVKMTSGGKAINDGQWHVVRS